MDVENVTRLRRSMIRETQGTDVTYAGCPANQHAQQIFDRDSPRHEYQHECSRQNSAPQELCTKLIQTVRHLGFTTPQALSTNLSGFARASTQQSSAQRMVRDTSSFTRRGNTTTQHDKRKETRPASPELETTTRS